MRLISEVIKISEGQQVEKDAISCEIEWDRDLVWIFLNRFIVIHFFIRPEDATAETLLTKNNTDEENCPSNKKIEWWIVVLIASGVLGLRSLSY